MVTYQLFQGAYVGRGDSDWKDRAGNNCHFTWGPNKKGDFVQLRKKLDYIQSLGVNTIELLPVNEYNGDDFLGYAPFRGSPLNLLMVELWGMEAPTRI